MKQTVQLSNPYSTGGGGNNFETRIQAAFTLLMLSHRSAPCLPSDPITKIKLQGRYAGFNTDDFIVFVALPDSNRDARLLAQIKHEVGITENNEVFSDVIRSAWADFNEPNFDLSIDRLGLITGPLSKTDTTNVRPLLEWARHSEDEVEFLTKARSPRFSSKAKRQKLDAFIIQLQSANGGTPVSDKQLWEFLKVFHLLGYDLDTEAGSVLSLLQALIEQRSTRDAPWIWARIIDAVQMANQNAGTITLDTLPNDLRAAFQASSTSGWRADIERLKAHSHDILDKISTEIGGIHISRTYIITQLMNLAEGSKFIFVSGTRGAGKSSVIKEFAKQIEPDTPLLCLRTEDLNRSHLDKVFKDIGLQSSFRELEAGYALSFKKYIVIESLEKLLELEHTAAFTDLLHFLKKTPGWTVVVTGRDYAYHQIVFNFLLPHKISPTTLNIEGFDDDDINQLISHVPQLGSFASNPQLISLLKTPFFADLAYRVIESGIHFSAQDGEEEFRSAVWSHVIAKEKERQHGMPLKRRRTFINLSVKRAKDMVYGVVDASFDEETLFKLQEDDLIRRDIVNGLVSPAHDVFEDWALEQYIEEAYQTTLGNTVHFLNSIGSQPAISRAFRLWLNQKLRDAAPITSVILSILENPDIANYWQDETITAILLGNNPFSFLQALKPYLLGSDNNLLERFCFMVHISCQTVVPSLSEELDQGRQPLLLQPYGPGWEAIIRFLFENKESLTDRLRPHVVKVLDTWHNSVPLDGSAPPEARQAGLLALYILQGSAGDFRHEVEGIDKLLQVIIYTVNEIREEFIALLSDSIFAIRDRRERPFYANTLCEMAFQFPQTNFLAKFIPDVLTSLAHNEWFIDEEIFGPHPQSRNTSDLGGYFGMYGFKYSFFPASGAKGPFRPLLRYHPRKGIDFILELLNLAATKYAHSGLDSSEGSLDIYTQSAEPFIRPIQVPLNDGTLIPQYCSARLWLGYRGHSGLPELLQSALMALENWLIAYVGLENSQQQLPSLFDYILRKSNSVMPTAVLASIATGFPNIVGTAALPLLKVTEFYSLDLQRTIHESGSLELNLFGATSSDPFRELYAEERHVAKSRPWRHESLQTLIVRLQWSQWRDEAFTAVDAIRRSATQTEKIQFLLHKIDTRSWNVIEDIENNQIRLEPKEIEPGLAEIQERTQAETALMNRYFRLSIWSRKLFERTALEQEYYEDWQAALVEAKDLLRLLLEGEGNHITAMYYGDIITVAALLVREHSEDLSEEDWEWCLPLIMQAILGRFDADNNTMISDATNSPGVVESASVLPIIFDISEEANEPFVKKLIAMSLTHRNEIVRLAAAKGVREHLWQRNSSFAQNCMSGSFEYAHFQQQALDKRERLWGFSDEANRSALTEWETLKENFRSRFEDWTVIPDIEPTTFETHNVRYLLIPCLMIPFGSSHPDHVRILSHVTGLFFEAEQNKQKRQPRYFMQRDELEVSDDLISIFIDYFSSYLLHLSDMDFVAYEKQLQYGCDVAPRFMKSLIGKAEQEHKKQEYRRLWKTLSPAVQTIAVQTAQESYSGRQSDKRDLVRSMLYGDIPWQRNDYETTSIALEKDLILSFARNTGKNYTVFEALSRLMHYFPSVFFEEGVTILSDFQQAESNLQLFSGKNTDFYVENAIRHYLQVDNTGFLKPELHQSCLVLLNVLVAKGSAEGYYLREHLIHSRRMKL